MNGRTLRQRDQLSRGTAAPAGGRRGDVPYNSGTRTWAIRTVLTAVLALTTLTVAAQSGQVSRQLCPSGDPAVVRINTIKPTSSMDAFLRAQEAHVAWYRKQGVRGNKIYAAPMFVLDDRTQRPKRSDTEVMTYHVAAPTDIDVPPSRDQVGWDAFVKQYRDASDIRAEFRICLPKER